VPDAGTIIEPLEEGAINQVIGAPIADLDILVIVDNSGSMREEQDALAANFNRFINVLNDTLGVLPNIHLGVVSTDLGGGPFGIMSCTGNGDNGILQNAPSGACATPGPERYIVDSLNTDGINRDTNYSGNLADTFSCIAKLGTTGCGFEQPLEAMRRALNGSNAENGGFLRDDAVLAVLLISDEDDCSVEDTAMFDSDPALDNIGSALGPLGSHRCFEFGVSCDPDTPRVAGARTNCTPRDDSQFMYDVGAYATFLENLKPVGGRTFFSAFAGVGPVSVGLVDGEPRLDPSCTSGAGDAVAGVRISALAGLMNMPPVQSICNPDLSGPLVNFGQNVSAKMGGQCLAVTATTGECRIVDVADFGTRDEAIVQEIPSCAVSAPGPCATFTPSSANCPNGSGIEISVDRRGTTVPANTVVVASCPQS
jgi:hypothetical protein